MTNSYYLCAVILNPQKMNQQEVNFPHLSSFIKRCSKQLQLTRDDLVCATGMCSDMASAV